MNDRELNHDLGREHSGRDHVGHDHMGHEQQGGSSHRWLMLACCVPMVLVVAVLLVTGVAGAGAVVFALICVGMMALMMYAMPSGHNH